MYEARDTFAQVILPLLIFTFGPISGAHFNPMVTACFVATKQMVRPQAPYPALSPCSLTERGRPQRLACWGGARQRLKLQLKPLQGA